MSRKLLGVIEESHVGDPFHVLANAPASLEAEGWGEVLPIDVGKRYYDIDGAFQIENNEQRDRRLASMPTRVGEGGSFGLKAEPRPYRCVNCGQRTMISTNHTSTCLHECRGCSWMPSFDGTGDRQRSRSIRVGRLRLHEYAGEIEGEE